MLAFELKPRRIRHALFRRKDGSVGVVVCGRKFPTVETEEGRQALLPNGSLSWAQKMGIDVFSPLQMPMQMA